MDRIAVLVDAGYLYAQGSLALSREVKPRRELRLDAQTVVAELIRVASAASGNRELLRIYWYDGVRGGRENLDTDQQLIADMDQVKLRLGSLNQNNQQKGVDSLIVTDLIDLARNNAISDALLLSGDEDVRVGVEVAQALGIRVHLLGITPARGSQSLQLRRAADTTHEWDGAVVSAFLQAADAPAGPAPQSESAQTLPDGDVRTRLEAVVQDYVARMEKVEAGRVDAAIQRSFGVPREHDGRLLAVSRDTLGRDLDQQEMRHLRTKFRELIAARGGA